MSHWKQTLANEKSLVFTLSFVFLLFSQVLVPQLNDGKDIFVFSSWSLFSKGPSKSVRDLTWDGGKTFLFRDHRTDATNSRINLTTLKYLLDSSSLQTLKKDFCRPLLDLSGSAPVEIVTLKNSWAEHMFSNKELQPLETQELCQ